MAESTRTLRVTVVGAGLAGGAVGAYLQKLPNVDVQLYERSTVSRQVGAWIGITPASQMLLDELCGEASVDAICTRTYGDPTVRDWASGGVVAEEPVSPESLERLSVAEKRQKRNQANTVRQDLHRIILEQISPERIHNAKKGVAFGVDEAGKVAVDFADGTSTTADLLVVSDGVNSKLRRQLYPNNLVKYMPSLEYMEVFDRAELEKSIPNLPHLTNCFMRDESMVFFGDVGCGRFSMICVVPDDPNSTRELGWAQTANAERVEHLRKHFQDWNPLIRQVLAHSKNMGLFPIARGAWLRSLIAHDRVCFAGDAAHPTGGAYSAGCSFAFEDAKTLYLALKDSHDEFGSWTPDATKRALQLYDLTRTPHLNRIFGFLEDQDKVQPGEDGAQIAFGDMTWMTNVDTEVEFQKAAQCAASLGPDGLAANQAALAAGGERQIGDQMVALRGSMQTGGAQGQNTF